MTWWAWLIVGIGVWALIVWTICLVNYCFWEYVDPRRRWR